MTYPEKLLQLGFTLIELTIVIAIIGILAAIAVPNYSTYVKRAAFSEIKMAVSPIKAAINVCYQRNAGLVLCNETVSTSATSISGQVTQTMLDRASSSSLVDSITLTAGASPFIRVISVSDSGFNGETYTLSGSVNGTPGTDARVSKWTEGGSGCTKGWC